MLTISGSYGEGGGQILRSALSLSAILSVPVRITDIRAKRPQPGLRPQHLTGVKAMADVCGAELSGVSVGSVELVFRPGRVRPGNYFFDVSRVMGSAGSVTLILQTLLPSLAMAGGPSRVTLAGGTHVPWSPPYHYIEDCFLGAVARMGVGAKVSLERWGFYPKGSGKVVLDVSPSGEFSPVDLSSRGDLISLKGLSSVANLPEGIAGRQARAASAKLRGRGLDADIEILNAPSPGQGTFIYLSARFANITAGFSALGERGKPAEAVGEEAADALLGFLESGACVEGHLADQLLLYMALAKGVSRMSVSMVTGHLLTNAWLIGQLMPEVKIGITGAQGEKGEVKVTA